MIAGIWKSWKSPEEGVIKSCSILATAANRLVAGLHDRMPVILSPDGFTTWIDRQTTNPVDLVHLFQSYPADLMEMFPVSPLVNSVKNESADLVAPVEDATATLDL